MSDFDAVIIGGGPAGLTAGLYLCRGGWRTLLIEKEVVGGYIMNIELIENYPGFPDGVVGSQLGMEMKNQAEKYGLKTERSEVIMVQLTAGDKMISCASGMVYTAPAVVIAGGSVPKKLGVPGENKLQGSGVFYCAFCDGGQYADRAVAVCGGGDSGATGALYMAKIASKVIIIEAMPELTATAVLRDRIKENPKIEVRCGTKVNAVLGEKQVEGIEIEEKGKKSQLKVDGVLVHVGVDPNTDYLDGVVPLDKQGRVAVNERMETEVPGIFAAGDIRSDSPGQVAAAVGDGATAAISAQQYLQKLA
ncbi:MAG: FAD-dependent oxidoreductase [Dehalococcoidales bacterium]|nr:FAD-dependent oxidoreductase [Dehalococcoidales bacterium]